MRKGDRFKLTEDAIDNYGEQYRDRVFTVSHVATRKGPPGGPEGTHPGYDGSGPLYDAEGLNFSLYDWEVIKVKR